MIPAGSESASVRDWRQRFDDAVHIPREARQLGHDLSQLALACEEPTPGTVSSVTMDIAKCAVYGGIAHVIDESLAMVEPPTGHPIVRTNVPIGISEQVHGVAGQVRPFVDRAYDRLKDRRVGSPLYRLHRNWQDLTGNHGGRTSDLPQRIMDGLGVGVALEAGLMVQAARQAGGNLHAKEALAMARPALAPPAAHTREAANRYHQHLSDVATRPGEITGVVQIEQRRPSAPARCPVTGRTAEQPAVPATQQLRWALGVLEYLQAGQYEPLIVPPFDGRPFALEERREQVEGCPVLHGRRPQRNFVALGHLAERLTFGDTNWI